MQFSDLFGSALNSLSRGFVAGQQGGIAELAALDKQRAEKQATQRRQSLLSQATEGLAPRQAAAFQLLSQDGLDTSFDKTFNPTDLDRQAGSFRANGASDLLRGLFANEAGLEAQEGFISGEELAQSGRIKSGNAVSATDQLQEDGVNRRADQTETGLNRRSDQTDSTKRAQLSFDERKFLAENELEGAKFLNDQREFGITQAHDNLKLALERDKLKQQGVEFTQSDATTRRGQDIDARGQEITARRQEINASPARVRLARAGGLIPGTQEFNDFLLQDTSTRNHCSAKHGLSRF